MVIDRSGSMSSCWTDVVGGYESIVKENKAVPGKCTFTVAAFDTEYELVEDFTDIQKVDEKLKVNPRGGTDFWTQLVRPLFQLEKGWRQ